MPDMENDRSAQPLTQTVDDNTAISFLRESHIQRQQQAGALDDDKVDSIRKGQSDSSIGFEDAKYGLTHFNTVWSSAQQGMGLSEGGQS